MNFATQLKAAISALALFAVIGVVTLAVAAGRKHDPNFNVDVMPTSIEIVASPASDGQTTMARVDVGSPVMTTAHPSAEDLARAAH
jgi:hypothetical protein